ncbi:tail fiber protein [Escherichia coli]|nr:tail fiber protein [Escherichia coli]EIY0472205.1 tail fiber protein [Escherichia coli]
MSTRKFRTLITDIGLAKLAATTAPGGKPVRLTHMAVGDGNGELRQPQKNQTSLYNEVWRQSVNRVFTDPENPNRLIAELVIPPETGGFWVREIGVFDDTGTMIAVGNTAESYKPTREEGSGRAQIFRAVITVTSDAVVELVMDTTTILPTTDYIDEKIAEHARSRNHPDATLTEKGFTQLSSATNSTSETLAATPKAVKAAYDLAAGKAPASHTHPWNQITGVPSASLTAKGIVQLSSDTNSNSETLAATPRAVKAAYDLAAGKAPASHTHPWNQITGVPSASLTAKGTVQLSSATNSESETEAATPKAVKALHDMLTSKYTGQDATTGRKGIVQLSSATNSNSETLAATPKAVSDALSMAFVKPTTSLGETDLNTLGRKEDAGDYYQQSDSGARTDRNYPVEKAGELRIRVGAWGFCQHEYTSWDPPRKFIRTVTGNFNGNGPWSEWVEVTNTDATTGRKGIVQLSSDTNSNSETLAATPRAVKAAYDLAARKAPASHTHPWNQITGVPSASLTAKGTVQLSSATNSNSETLAATPRAVKAAYDLANSKAAAAHTHRWAQITDAPVFSSVARVIMGKQSIKDILDYLGLGEGSTLPVGVPVPWPSSRPPEGWLQCNGAAFTRTKYPKLAVAYPDLRLPDLRGEFIRGWDDLRMIDRGRLLLSTQEATYICTAIQAYHGVAGGADIQAGISFASHDNDIINITPDQPRTGNGILYGRKPVDRWAIARAGKLVSNEKDRWIAIRPRNIAFNYIVRAV